MAERPAFLTREGMEKLEEELEYLRTVRREEVAHRLHEAMEGGDIQENAEYEDARNERAFVEGRILTLETILSKAVLIEDGTGPTDHVGLGSRVTVKEVNGDEAEPEHYHVVGSAEADPVDGQQGWRCCEGERTRWPDQIRDHRYWVRHGGVCEPIAMAKAGTCPELA
jgi:transcription elongation factor GreA